jgi:hypothetical protein
LLDGSFPALGLSGHFFDGGTILLAPLLEECLVLVGLFECLIFFFGEMFQLGDALSLIADDLHLLGRLFFVLPHAVLVLLVVLLFELELLLEQAEFVGEGGDDLLVFADLFVVAVELVLQLAEGFDGLFGFGGAHDGGGALADGGKGGVATHYYYYCRGQGGREW